MAAAALPLLRAHQLHQIAELELGSQIHACRRAPRRANGRWIRRDRPLRQRRQSDRDAELPALQPHARLPREAANGIHEIAGGLDSGGSISDRIATIVPPPTSSLQHAVDAALVAEHAGDEVRHEEVADEERHLLEHDVADAVDARDVERQRDQDRDREQRDRRLERRSCASARRDPRPAPRSSSPSTTAITTRYGSSSIGNPPPTVYRRIGMKRMISRMKPSIVCQASSVRWKVISSSGADEQGEHRHRLTAVDRHAEGRDDGQADGDPERLLPTSGRCAGERGPAPGGGAGRAHCSVRRPEVPRRRAGAPEPGGGVADQSVGGRRRAAAPADRHVGGESGRRWPLPLPLPSAEPRIDDALDRLLLVAIAQGREQVREADRAEDAEDQHQDRRRARRARTIR